MIHFNEELLQDCPIYSWRVSVFTPEECDTIKPLMQTLTPSGTMGGVNPEVRASSNVWVPFQEEYIWMFNRIAEASKECNPWKVHLTGFFEPLQLTHYSDEEYYNYHTDIGPGDSSIRKLSCVIQLSDPNDYAGADLEFPHGNKNDELRAQGTAIFFPSYTVHRVSPCYEGQRYSLVSWISGGHFR